MSIFCLIKNRILRCKLDGRSILTCKEYSCGLYFVFNGVTIYSLVVVRIVPLLQSKCVFSQNAF